MPRSFVACDRDQSFLMPPDLREWLPPGHLVWLVLDTVGQMDLDAFYGAYRRDGHGRPAYDPVMMVALVLYAYARNERSSRVIERECLEDIAYRVIAVNERPDHSTIARFVVRHETALAGVFGGVLAVCAKAGLVSVGVVAVDGSKVPAAANKERTLDYEELAREILADAKAVDAAEDELYGERRGDELLPELSTAQGRKAWIRKAMRELEQEQEREQEAGSGGGDGGSSEQLDRSSDRRRDLVPIAGAGQGRRGWLREARRDLERKRALASRPIARSRQGRLLEAMRQLDEELDAERQANAAYEEYRAQGRMRDGRRFGGPPDPYVPPDTPTGRINVVDPDSRLLKATRGYVQGYNAQAVSNEHQIVIAAEVNVDSPDFGHLEPMLAAAECELAAAGVTEAIGVTVADAGYWHHVQMQNIINRGIQVLIPPDGGKRRAPRPGWEGGYYDHMRRVLATDYGGDLYRKRQGMIEPVFAQTKHNRGIDRFRRRGRSAVRTEWRLITATHNLMKLHKHQTTLAAA